MNRITLTPESITDAVRTLRPPAGVQDDVRRTVADIIDMVRGGGDDAVRRLTRRLDHAEVTHPAVAGSALTRALDDQPEEVRDALRLAAANLRLVAADMMPRPAMVTLPQGQTVRIRHVPVQRVGVYVPGGRAAYPSSAVMAIVPAEVAGVPEICVCSPPLPTGLPQPSVLAACALLGVREVYAVGGAQAVAAMAIGTEEIPKVDLLVGPGNAYVEEAKRRLFGEIGIESLAGPSELIALVDETAPADAIAYDLIAQAEHGSGSQSVLLSANRGVLAAVAEHLPEDGDIVLVEADSIDTAVQFVNAYAPEHLQLAVADPHAMLERIVHAGAVFLGPWSGTAFGDYVAGSNHILPTAGSARFSSGLSPAVFLRSQEVIEIPAEAVPALAPPLSALATAEGLPNHARSAQIRVEQMGEPTATRGRAT